MNQTDKYACFFFLFGNNQNFVLSFARVNNLWQVLFSSKKL